MKFRVILSIQLLLIFVGLDAEAAVCRATTERIQNARYHLSAGQHLKVRFENESTDREVVFMGKLLQIDGSIKDLSFFDFARQEIHFVPVNEVEIFDLQNQPLDLAQVEPIVRALPQEGGTCAAFSILNCFRQMSYYGYQGNTLCKQKLDDELHRTRLLTRVLNDFYLDGEYRGAVETLSGELGYQTYPVPDNSVAAFKDGLEKHLGQSWPILFRFDVASKMSQTPYRMIDHEDQSEYDRRLWLPRGRFESQNGGHLVLALKVFQAGGEKYVIVSDPNWQAPRLWNMAEFDKLGSASIYGWVVWDDGKQVPVKQPKVNQIMGEE